MKIWQNMALYNARKKSEQKQHRNSLKNERKTLLKHFWAQSGINSKLETVESIRNEIKDRNVPTWRNLDAEKPSKQFFAMISKQEWKIWIMHLRRKRPKRDAEKISHPKQDLYDNLKTQEEISAEVSGFYSEFYKKRESNPKIPGYCLHIRPRSHKASHWNGTPEYQEANVSWWILGRLEEDQK